LARFACPGWEVVDLIKTDQVPASPVCWFPDTTARILYAGRDGNLYRFSFDDPDAGLQPLEWRTPLPRRVLLLADPVWPCGSRWSHRLVVALTFLPDSDESDGSDWPAPYAQLWWLQLDPARSAVIAMGRLITPGPGEPALPVGEEGMPAISTGADGRQ